MKKAIPVLCLSFFLCACSSHNKTASINGLTPSQADSMNEQHATIVTAKDPPVTANTRYAAGQLAEAQGNLDAAVHQYNSALDRDPKNLPSLYRLGVIYAECKKFDKSLETWKRYATVSGNSAESYGNLGFCYELMGQSKMAEQTYQKGIAKDPKNASCRTNYGMMLAREHHITEAVRMWNPVLTDAEIHYNLASIYQLDGRKQEARAEYQKALVCDPNLIDAKARMAEIDTQP